MDVAPFRGHLERAKTPLAAEVLAALEPEPLLPVERTSWHAGSDHCEVTETEVVFWSGVGHGESGTSCSLDAFFEGRLQDSVRSVFGGAVLREVLNVVRTRLAAAPEPRPPRKPVKAKVSKAPAKRPRKRR